MFTRKAQLAHYESTRAQFEAFAAGGWAGHKMTIYWMLNNHWPSFFGHLFDYYLRPGGAYYGAKTGLRPLSVVFDSYATGDHDEAAVTVVNQTPGDRQDLQVRVRVYDLQGRVREDRTAQHIDVASGTAASAVTLPRVARDSPVFFVRCELRDADGGVVGENTYWQSQQRDDVGDPRNDQAFELRQTSWADMTALNTMPRAPLEVTAGRQRDTVVIRLHNPGRRRVLRAGRDPGHRRRRRDPAGRSTPTTTSLSTQGRPSRSAAPRSIRPPRPSGSGCRGTTRPRS